ARLKLNLISVLRWERIYCPDVKNRDYLTRNGNKQFGSGFPPFHRMTMSKAALKLFLRSRETLPNDEPVGTFGTDGLREAPLWFGSALVRSSVSRNPLRFFSLMPHHTEITRNQVRHTLGFGYRR
ncbi:MAG: hypothetical protein P8Y92_17245, partial [Halioglobus sp.]